MKNSAGRGGFYSLRPKAEVDKTLEICRILHILRKPNSIIALLFIQNIFFAQTCKPTHSLFARNNITSSPGFLSQWFNNLQRAALVTSFWRQWFNNLQRGCTFHVIGWIWQNSLQIWSTTAGYGELCVWF